jgi:hypothetical protein
MQDQQKNGDGARHRYIERMIKRKERKKKRKRKEGEENNARG